MADTKFRVEIPPTNFIRMPGETRGRVEAFVERRARESGAEIWVERQRSMPIYSGVNVPADIRAVLTAIAAGHDVDALIDMYEKGEKGDDFVLQVSGREMPPGGAKELIG